MKSRECPPPAKVRSVSGRRARGRRARLVRRRRHDGLAHNLGLVIAKAVQGWGAARIIETPG